MPDLSTYKPGSYHDYDVGGNNHLVGNINHLIRWQVNND